MEKETVLEIEFMPVWDKWAWRITENELFNLRDGLQEYENKTLQLKLKKGYESCFFMYNNVTDNYEETPNCILLYEREKERLEKFIERVNEKYGKPKRWRAERNRGYYYINDYGIIYYTTDDYVSADNDRYEIGNYFKTQEQAKKALERVKKVLQEVEENVEM